MGVTLCVTESNGKDFIRGSEESSVRYGRATWAELARRGRDRLPQNHRLPAIYRLPGDGGAEPVAQGELARDTPLALVEAALLSADEPLTARRLAAVAGLADGTEARRQVRRLQALYDRDA